MHPQRTTLHNELHARPSLYFDGPAHVFHFALLGGDAACQSLLQRCCPEAPDPYAAQGITSSTAIHSNGNGIPSSSP